MTKLIRILPFLALAAGSLIMLPVRSQITSITPSPITDFRGKVVVIKQRLSGSGPFGSALHNHPSWGIFKITDGNTVAITQSTLVLNALFGNAKWWDHAVTASRACEKTGNGWDNPSKCVEGTGGVIRLPDNADFRNYIYEFKWEENGSVKFWKAEIMDANSAQ
jgi:hypothetical protein